MTTLTMAELEAARRDPVVFADRLIGQPLWPHQVEVARSSARYRVLCAGRRAGKSRVYGALALHEAFSRPGAKVLIVSAGEVAAKRLFAEVAAMSKAPLLGGSTVDETTSTLLLSNGSVVECVPASMRQVRSAEADLLIIDEAGFVAQEIWEAAEPVVLARPGSRVLLASTPWGGPDHFFRQLWHRGRQADQHVASWHWPSSVSPMVDADLLEQIRERSAPHYFAREYLAEWTDDIGAFFTSLELEEATTDYELVPPEECSLPRGWNVVGGVDWGSRNDANTLVVIGRAPEHTDDRGRQRYRVWWLEEHFQSSYDQWIDRLVEVSGRYPFVALAAETNGVGDYPSTTLARRLALLGRHVVVPTQTTAKLKENGFGLVKLLLQSGRLELPPHPGLLRQLHALTIERTDSGSARISVPDRVGHDDLAMALCLAILQTGGNELPPAPTLDWGDEDEWEFEEATRIGPDW